MTTFDNREKAFENQFVMDEATRFKAEARSVKLLGLWAADLMRKFDEDADMYAKSLVATNMDEPGLDDVKARLRADFDAHGVDVSDAEIDQAIVDKSAEAAAQIQAEKQAQ